MTDQRFPGPRHHITMNGRVSWNCVPLHSVAASTPVPALADALRDVLGPEIVWRPSPADDPWLDYATRIAARLSGDEGADR